MAIELTTRPDATVETAPRDAVAAVTAELVVPGPWRRRFQTRLRELLGGFDTERTYSVPVQFSLGSIIAFTTLFAVLFAASRWLDLQPWLESAVVPLLFLAAGAQWWCNRRGRGDAVRSASVWIGGVWLALYSLVALTIGGDLSWGMSALPFLALCGMLFGYLAGGVVAGVYLFGGLIDHYLSLRRSGRPPAAGT